jgi:2-keto-4-pentenoate hydratase/2-oxohepta-3-ene-1,7-dioic acid hydratase in catechol pathway
MATLDEVGALQDLHMCTWLNGHKVQDVRAGEMIFDIPTLLVYVSGFITLEPGDILSTGSPEREPVPGRASPYLQVGDTVDIEIDGVGRLSNPVISRGW